MTTGLFLFLATQIGITAPDKAQLAVWANEAIVATYTFDSKNFLQQQREIAKYFTSDGWIAYTKALDDSKLPEAVQKNAYEVTAVATQPPIVTPVNPTHWQATMTVLVVYKNPQYQQQQNLKVILNFMQAPSGQGVRGLAVTSLQSSIIEPPCECKIPQTENAIPVADK
nr:DotI/IcmL family type IV secretion protein [Legionella worsleiensis]